MSAKKDRSQGIYFRYPERPEQNYYLSELGEAIEKDALRLALMSHKLRGAIGRLSLSLAKKRKGRAA